MLEALESILTELARVRLHGISAPEFERALRDEESGIENTALEADKAYSEDVRDEYVRNFLYGELVSGAPRSGWGAARGRREARWAHGHDHAGRGWFLALALGLRA